LNVLVVMMKKIHLPRCSGQLIAHWEHNQGNEHPSILPIAYIAVIHSLAVHVQSTTNLSRHDTSAVHMPVKDTSIPFLQYGDQLIGHPSFCRDEKQMLIEDDKIKLTAGIRL